jgi:hypothetical protein
VALPLTALSDLLYLAASHEVYNKLKGAGFLNETGLADSEAINRMGELARVDSAASGIPGPNHADLLADALFDAGVLNEAGVKAYYLDMRGI